MIAIPMFIQIWAILNVCHPHNQQKQIDNEMIAIIYMKSLALSNPDTHQNRPYSVNNSYKNLVNNP